MNLLLAHTSLHIRLYVFLTLALLSERIKNFEEKDLEKDKKLNKMEITPKEYSAKVKDPGKNVVSKEEKQIKQGCKKFLQAKFFLQEYFGVTHKIN